MMFSDVMEPKLSWLLSQSLSLDPVMRKTD